MIPDRLASLLDLDPADRRDADQMLRESATSAGSAAVRVALDVLDARLGAFPPRPTGHDPADAAEICAILRFAQRAADWHTEQGVDPSISAATLADVGRHFRLHRQTHGAFGLETGWFLSWHLAGSLYQLGRLQFALRPPAPGETLPPGEPQWLLDVHIPPTGPLLPTAVDAALRQAVEFFGSHFRDRPVRTALCSSWLLDPYLAEHLPDVNISRFQSRFAPYRESRPAQGDVLYFVFGTRSTTDLDRLPRATSLQRAILDRIAEGGTWRSYRGYLTLPGSGALTRPI